MNTHVFATTEIGRMRREEAIARASHYRLTQIAKRRAEKAERGAPLSPVQAIVFRRALKVAALSVIVASAGVVLF